MIRMVEVASLSIVLAAACGGKDKNQPSEPMAAGAEPGGAQPGEAQPCGAQPCGEEAAQAEPAEVDVADWASWPKVTKERFFSKSHNESWVQTHVPEEYVDAYVGGGAPPDGMKIVKAQYPSEEAESPQSLTVMVRQEAPSGWFWGVYSPDGRQAMQQGELSSCVGCHETAGEYMLFRKLQD